MPLRRAACFLGAGEDNADFGVLKLDALFLESLEDGYAHIAAGKVVVRAVNDAFSFHIQ